MQLLLCLLLTLPTPASPSPWTWQWPTGWSAQPEWSAQSPVRQQQPDAPNPQTNLPKFTPPTTPRSNNHQQHPSPQIQVQTPTPTPTLPTLTTTAFQASPQSLSSAQFDYTPASTTPSRWHFNLTWFGYLEISSGLFLISPGFIQPIYIISPEPRPITASAPGYNIQDHAIRPWLEPGSAQLYITFQTSP